MRHTLTKIAITLLLHFCAGTIAAAQEQVQNDTVQISPRRAAKFSKNISRKAATCYNRISRKTEKTLEKLARWESKLEGLIRRVNPGAAEQLFSQQLSFASMLRQYREGQAIAARYGRQYDEYRDKLNNTVKYLAGKDSTAGITAAAAQLQQLDTLVNNTEALQQLIKERKKQLMDLALQYIGKSKYLQKINKEVYYYAATLRNYKELFSDPDKVEELVVTVLKKIPAFNEFLQRNSLLSGLFALPGGGNAGASLAGLQTRASVQNMIQQQFGGPNAMAALRSNIDQAQAQLNQLKEKVLQAGGGNSSTDLPDFKPNNQKTKTFLQRLEFGSNLQHQRSNAWVPVSSDIGLSVGYKINDRSVAGLGLSGRVGWGKNIQNIRITAEGAGFRSFVNWKLKSKGSFWLSGGAELNYQARFYSTAVFSNFSNWQQSALIGLMKQYRMGRKAKGSMSLLFDLLYNQQLPARQPVVFRVGWGLK